MSETATASNLEAAQQDSAGANNSGEAPCPLNKVAAHVEAEFKVVLLDRKLAAHQDPADDPIQADPTYIVVWLTQSNDKENPWVKGGKLTVTPANGTLPGVVTS